MALGASQVCQVASGWQALKATSPSPNKEMHCFMMQGVKEMAELVEKFGREEGGVCIRPQHLAA